MDSRITKNHYKMRDASEIIGVPASTLRFWEQEFDELKPRRSSSNQRYYSATDMELLQIIHYLLHIKGLKIEKAKEQIRHNRNNISKKIKIIEKLQEAKEDLSLLLDSLNKRGEKLGLSSEF